MEINPFTDEFFMKEALKEASKASQLDEVPVGAVVVCENQIIARAHNYTQTLNDVTAHAEMLAFTSAFDFLGGKYLDDCTLYFCLDRTKLVFIILFIFLLISILKSEK